MSRIVFPLRTNIKSFQRWGDHFDISRRIKQSIILFDDIILEAGTFCATLSDEIALERFVPWSESNTMESALKEFDKIENRPDEDYIKLRNGKTDKLKKKWKINKEDNYFADYRILDLYTEINAGGYEKQIDFIKY